MVGNLVFVSVPLRGLVGSWFLSFSPPISILMYTVSTPEQSINVSPLCTERPAAVFSSKPRLPLTRRRLSAYDSGRKLIAQINLFFVALRKAANIDQIFCVYSNTIFKASFWI